MQYFKGNDKHGSTTWLYIQSITNLPLCLYFCQLCLHHVIIAFSGHMQTNKNLYWHYLTEILQ